MFLGEDGDVREGTVPMEFNARAEVMLAECIRGLVRDVWLLKHGLREAKKREGIHDIEGSLTYST